MDRAIARAVEEKDRLLLSDPSSATFTQETIAYRPRDGDYPLWKVQCRVRLHSSSPFIPCRVMTHNFLLQVGIEEYAVFSLMNTAREHHQVRSAFTRGTVRGSIYIEATMNYDLIALLKITPGIIYNRQGVHRRMVDPNDYLDTLTMRNHKTDVVAGDWVVVNKGWYKGDTAFVEGTHSWGARLLLVPRLDSTPRISRKRKASSPRPDAILFDPETFQHLPKFTAWEDRPGRYALGSLSFEDGLLVKDFDYHSFQTGVTDIPYEHFLMFKHTRRISHDRMLRPREWSFHENEKILILSENKTAIVKSTHPFFAEVERGDTIHDPLLEHTDHIHWHNIRKDIKIGDFVRVVSGACTGEMGWVVEVKDELATIAKKLVDGDISKHDRGIEVCNLCKL